MRNLISGSLIFLFLAACTVSRYSELKSLGNTVVEGGKLNPYQGGLEKTLKFTAAFDIYGHYLSGLLFIKQTGDSTFRAVLTNELGIKIFDFININGQYETVFCVEPLNKSILTNALCKGLFLLGAKYPADIICELLTGNDSTLKIVSLPYYEESKNYFFINKKNGELTRLENASSWLKYVVISYRGYTAGIPDSAEIEFANLSINIKLKQLKITNAP